MDHLLHQYLTPFFFTVIDESHLFVAGFYFACKAFGEVAFFKRLGGVVFFKMKVNFIWREK